jgi:hypothetical protein
MVSISGILLGKTAMLTLRFPQPMLAAANGEFKRKYMRNLQEWKGDRCT